MASTLFDANNSSTTNLTAGSTFTGTATSALGVFSIVTILSCDQTCVVHVFQSGDGSNFDVTDTFAYIPGKSFGIVTQVVGKSYKIQVTNSGAVTTTTLRLETLRQDTSNTLPRALDTFGNLKTSLNGLYDQFGYQGSFCPRRQLWVAEATHLVGSTFNASQSDTNFWTVTNSGTGSVADIGTTTTAVATLSSGTANSGFGQLHSVSVAGFLLGSANKFLAFCRLTATTVANTTRVWGVLNDSSNVTPLDGYYFSVSGTGALSVNSVKNGSVTSVASGSFNGSVSQFVMDTNLHTYEILYGSFGAQFLIDAVLIHAMSPVATPTLTNTLNLQVYAWSANSASGTTSATLQVSNAAIHRIGRPASESLSKSFQTAASGTTTLKLGPGLVTRLIIGVQANANTIILYDNTTNSGTQLFNSGAITKNNPLAPVSIDLGDMPFFTGLTLNLSGSASVTVVYK